MMSLAQIREMSAAATAKAAQKDQRPYMLDGSDFDNIATAVRYGIPYLGDYVHPDYEMVDTMFVDTSGFGAEHEPALTQDQFYARLKPGMGIGIVETGEFQAVVGIYRKRLEGK